MEIYNPFLGRYENYTWHHTRETEFYNNQMYKLKDSVKKNILCHDIYNLSQIEERIEKGELPWFTSSSLHKNIYTNYNNTMSMVVNDELITKKQWLDIFRDPHNPSITSFIQSLNLNHWSHLSQIEEAIPLLALHLDKVDWNYLTKNTNPDVIPILENNLEKVDKMFFCTNPNILPFLENHPETIRWAFFVWNLSIYEPDYENIRKLLSIFKEELMAVVFHPKRISRLIEFAREEPNSLDFLFLEKWVNIFKEELIAAAFHPRRIGRWMDLLGETCDVDTFF